ncbi:MULTISPECIES: BON domain-containing protein [unclassified Achromobacter]|uniref:BON domain-containing protein n=1 Tax=unclassified Achromobacter TaxID=2626865 RepID=UPI000B5186BF|nr:MULTISPECIES: BON domain-containing protein [unclassified Achromobacter]OWT74688.1 ornithine aminotransferase [Achromobacter sp. HZ34]OWT79155.1 ornithine aminotransferase [Achromobacter sp. HZ28]
MDDKTLQQDVTDELNFEPGVNAAHIGVAVDRGIVTLSGHVGSYLEKMATERAVGRVRGVRGIAEELQVRYPNDKRAADDQIAERALNILAWYAGVPGGAVQVQVQKGWVTLTGAVSSGYQRFNAETAVQRLHGVTGITNQIRIKPTAVAGDVHKVIEEALRRNAELNARKVRVTIDGSRAVLEGAVGSWRERAAVERAAWSAPGVMAVEDRITVS